MRGKEKAYILMIISETPARRLIAENCACIDKY